MDSDYKMTQTEMHEFTIHGKPSGVLLATITRTPGGQWSTHPTLLTDGPGAEADADGDADAAPFFEDQAKPQAAFNAFIARSRA